MRQGVSSLAGWCGALALGLVVLGPPSRAAACSCAPQTVEAAIEGADAIFEGQVRGLEGGDGPVGPKDRTVSFAVVRAWKGEPGPRVKVRTRGNTAACGYPFEKGRSYLVYARTGRDGTLTAGLCSRTRAVSEAPEDLAALGAGITPVDVASPGSPKEPPDKRETSPKEVSPSASGCASCSATPARPPALLLVLFGLALFFGLPAYRASLR